MPVRFWSALLMDTTLKDIMDMAQETYPDDMDRQVEFIEGAYLALHFITLAELKGVLEDDGEGKH